MRKILTLWICICFVGAFAFSGCGVDDESGMNSETTSASWSDSGNGEEETDSGYSEEDIEVGNGIEYVLSHGGDHYSVVGVRDFTETELVVPSTYNGLPVRFIRESAFYRCLGVTSIEIGDNVQYIESYAFGYCENLIEVEIGNDVTLLGNYVFLGCEALMEVTIPDSVTSIGYGVFDRCDNLMSVVFENAVGWSADEKSFSESELSDPEAATVYLTDTYRRFPWKRIS